MNNIFICKQLYQYNVDLLYDKGNYVRFTSAVRELEAAGKLLQGKLEPYPFDFHMEKPFETYSGFNVKLRYFIRVTISRAYNNNYVTEVDFGVENGQLLVRLSDHPN